MSVLLLFSVSTAICSDEGESTRRRVIKYETDILLPDLLHRLNK